MKLFIKNQILSNTINSNNFNSLKSAENSEKDLIYLEMQQNNTSNSENKGNASDDKSSNQRPSEENYSIRLMRQYPLGFNEDDEADEKGSKVGSPTPRKKKKPKKKYDDEGEEPDKEEEEDRNCFYNVWVQDCLRSKKDFIECQQINLHELDTREMFEKLFIQLGFFLGSSDYDDFMQCEKSSSTRILQGIESKFRVDINVSDSFFSLTGAKLRAYSFQGTNRKSVFSAFSYFSGTWSQEMAINSVRDYDMLFQPDDWYYSVIMVDDTKKHKDDREGEMNEEKTEGANVSNKNCLSKSTNKNTSNLKFDESYRRNLNFQQIDTNSEIDSTENINNDKPLRKEMVTKKNEHGFNLCVKYFKVPKLKFWKLLFTNIKQETESISYTISNVAKMVNENNNKLKDSMSINVANASLSLNPNHEIVDFLLDTYNKPIPIWVKLNKSELFNI